MSQLLDSRLDEERLRDCLEHDARMRVIRHPAATCLDDAEACLRAARRTYAVDDLRSTARYVEAAIYNLQTAIVALWDEHEPKT